MVDKASRLIFSPMCDLDEFANAIFQGGRKAASVQVWRFGHRHEAEHAQPGL